MLSFSQFGPFHCYGRVADEYQLVSAGRDLIGSALGCQASVTPHSILV